MQECLQIFACVLDTNFFCSLAAAIFVCEEEQWQMIARTQKALQIFARVQKSSNNFSPAAKIFTREEKCAHLQ